MAVKRTAATKQQAHDGNARWELFQQVVAQAYPADLWYAGVTCAYLPGYPPEQSFYCSVVRYPAGGGNSRKVVVKAYGPTSGLAITRAIRQWVCGTADGRAVPKTTDDGVRTF